MNYGVYAIEYKVETAPEEFGYDDTISVIAADCEEAITKLQKHLDLGSDKSFEDDDGETVSYRITGLVVISANRIAKADI